MRSYKDSRALRRMEHGNDEKRITGCGRCISVTVRGNEIKASVNDEVSVAVHDEEKPYLSGGIGLSVQNGSHLTCKRITVSPLK